MASPKASSLDPEEIFDILQQLGDTSFGTLYIALDKRSKEVTSDVTSLEIFQMDDIQNWQDIPVLNKLHGLKCAQLVCYHEVFIKNDTVWFSLDYCHPGSVSDMIQVTNHQLKEEQIQMMMRCMLTALHCLHSNGITHSNVKADNIWIDCGRLGILLSPHRNLQNWELVVNGFVRQQGTKYKLHIPAELLPIFMSFFPEEITVKLHGMIDQHIENLHRNDSGFFTPYWMAPEVIRDNKRSSKEDIWSLGITAIELATGKPPHAEMPPLKALFLIPKSEPPRLPEHDGNGYSWSDGFRSFVAQCLVMDPQQRKSAKQLLQHEWIQQSQSSYVLVEWVKQTLVMLEQSRREKPATPPKDDWWSVRSI